MHLRYPTPNPLPRLLAVGLAFCAAVAPALAQRSTAGGGTEPEPTTSGYLRVADGLPVAAAREVIESEAPARFGLAADELDLREVASRTDDLGMTHVTFQQTYRGLPVDGYTYTAHAAADTLATLTGRLAEVDDVATAPALTPEAALEAALDGLGLAEPLWGRPDAPDDYARPRGELVVWHDAESAASALAYKFDVYTAEPLYRAWVYVSATTGEVLAEDLRIHHADTPVRGRSLYNGGVDITVDRRRDGTYRLRQSVSGGGVETYALANDLDYGSASDVVDDATPFNSDRAAVQAHYGAEQTYDYFLRRHNRDSYDGEGATLKSYVHALENYPNAFWDGSRMTYGDGDGEVYGSLTSLDIAGHEIAHGVIEFASGLVYRNESGALNESFADIFGELVEHHATGSNDWLIGDDVGVDGSGAFRSLRNPQRFGHPDTYRGDDWFTGSEDNGGVHYNSGVQNRWFYVLAEGASGTNDRGSRYDVAGIGLRKAARIAYRNLTRYLSPHATYADARDGAIQAARDLYGAGSPEERRTTNAWYAVGVGAAYGQPETDATDAESPTRPGRLRAIRYAEDAIALRWDASRDNVGVDRYVVSVDGVRVGTARGTDYVATGLDPATSYRFAVRAIDGAGNRSGRRALDATTAYVLRTSTFERGLGGWELGGADAARVASARSYRGDYSIRLRDDAGRASAMTTDGGYDFRGGSSARLEFYALPRSFERGEGFVVQYNGDDGGGWAEVANFRVGRDFANDRFHRVVVTLNPVDYRLARQGRFRIRCAASGDGDLVFVDQVSLSRTGRTGDGGPGLAPATSQKCREVETPGALAASTADPAVTEGAFAATASPNPTSGLVDVSVTNPDLVLHAELYGPAGRLLARLTASDLAEPVDLTARAAGMYVLRVYTAEEGVATLRLLKR